MKRHFLWILPAVALLSPALALAQEAPKATVADNLDVSVTTKKETEADGRKTTETNTGSFSVNDKETVTPDGKTTSDHGREVGFEHKTETEVSKGDHHEVKVSENDSIRANTDVSTDGGNGDTATVGVGYTKGYNADAEIHAGADGKYAGGNVEADARAHAGLDADATWTVGPDGIVGTADVRFGADAEVHVGADGRLGTEDYNVHVGADVKISAEAAAEIKARILAGEEGFGAEAEAKAGVSVGAEGAIKGGVTIWGIPFDVVLSGGVKAGAEASARGGIMYDAETGKLTLELGASAVAGVGGKVGATVEIGVGQLFGKALDLLFGEDEKKEEGKDTGTKSGDSDETRFCPIPEQDSAEGQDETSGSVEKTQDQGAKPDVFQEVDNKESAENGGGDEQVLVCEVLPVENPQTFTCKKTEASNIPEFNEPDWREKHPIWAFILERVLPEFIRMIIDILLNHPELTIESLLKFDENGNPIIHDGVPEFNPDIEIDEIPTHPLPQTCEIPNEGTSDEDVFKDATEANRNAKDALLTPPECNCNESVVKLLELQNLIERHKKAIEDFRLAHIAYEKSFDAIADRIGEVFIDIGGNAFGALMGPHIKTVFEIVAKSVDLYTKEGLSFWGICWKLFEHFIDTLKEFFIWEPSGTVIIPEKMLENIEDEFVEELGERTSDIAAMFAKILVKLPFVMFDSMVDWWNARSANNKAREELAELTNRLNIEVSIYLANEGCYCKPGCMCKHCLVKRKIVITYPDDPDNPWHWVYGGNITTPNDILIGDGGGYENGGIIGGVPDLGSLIDGIGGGVLDSGGISIPDFGVSGSDSPIVPDSIGNPAIAITASGILNTANINSDKGKASVVVDGNKGGGASKRNIGDIGGQGQSQIWSNQK